MRRTVKISIIGAGAMAFEHLRVFSTFNNTEILGIHSRTRSKAVKLAKFFKIPFIAKNINELYKKTKSDLVIVAVNETSTEKICFNCFKFPWKIFVEKPVGYNFSIAKKIYEESLIYKSKLLVAMNRRHYSSTKSLLKLIKNANGKKIITIIDSQDLNLAKKFKTPEVILKNYMFANSVHLIDYFNFIIKSDIKKINTIVKNRTFISAIISFKNGDIGKYICYWNRPGPWSVNLSTEKMYISLTPLEKIEYRNNKSYKNHKLATSKEDLIYKPGFYDQSKEIIKFMLDQNSKVTTMKDFLKTMKIIHKIYN